jgi:hypothetical protein
VVRQVLSALAVSVGYACADAAGPAQQVDGSPLAAPSVQTRGAESGNRRTERRVVTLPVVREEGRTLGGAAALAYLKQRLAEAAASGELIRDVPFKNWDGKVERIPASEWLSRLEMSAKGPGITGSPNPRYDDSLTASASVKGSSLVVSGGNGTRFDFVSTSLVATTNKNLAEMEKVIHTGHRQVWVTGGPPLYDRTDSDSSGSLKYVSSTYYTTTWPSVTVGKDCGYIASLTTNHNLRWKAKVMGPIWQPRNSYDNSLDRETTSRPCIPPPDPRDPSSLCDNPSVCSPQPGSGGWDGYGDDVSAEGQVVIPTLGGGGGTLTCTVTDWYDVWMDGTWHYRATEVDSCVLS